MKKIILILLIISLNIPVFALEDCLVITKGKLTDIRIEDHNIIDVYPLTTLMNEKNTLIVHPIQTGKTHFCVLKNGKKIEMFNVEVKEDTTIIGEKNGFDILQIDCPPEIYEYELDEPPVFVKGD